MDLPDLSFIINCAKECGVEPEDFFGQIFGEIRRMEDDIPSVHIL